MVAHPKLYYVPVETVADSVGLLEMSARTTCILNLAALSPVDPASRINASMVSAEVNTLALEPEAPVAASKNGVKPAANAEPSIKQSTSPPVIPTSKVTLELPLAYKTSRTPATIMVSAGTSIN